MWLVIWCSGKLITSDIIKKETLKDRFQMEMVFLCKIFTLFET